MPRSREFWIKLTIGIIFGLSWIAMIGWKKASPEINLKNPLIVMIILSVFYLVAIFGKTIYNQIRKVREEEVPDAISSEKLKEIVEKEVEKNWNMLKIENPFEWIRSKVINKNIIYAIKLNLVHEINIDGKEYESCIMIINSNFPEEQPTIISPSSSEQYIDRRMNDKSKSPLEEPEVEERTETDLSTGREVKYRKTSQKKKEEDKGGSVV